MSYLSYLNFIQITKKDQVCELCKRLSEVLDDEQLKLVQCSMQNNGKFILSWKEFFKFLSKSHKQLMILNKIKIIFKSRNLKTIFNE